MRVNRYARTRYLLQRFLLGPIALQFPLATSTRHPLQTAAMTWAQIPSSSGLATRAGSLLLGASRRDGAPVS
jgi:hypothetical protein